MCILRELVKSSIEFGSMKFRNGGVKISYLFIFKKEILVMFSIRCGWKKSERKENIPLLNLYFIYNLKLTLSYWDAKVSTTLNRSGK